MKYGLSNNSLDRINTIFKQFPAIETVYLYGSRAKGNYKPSSDIDIALKGNKLNLHQLSSVMAQLDDLLLPYKFDVSIYHQIDNKELLDHINRIGVTVYSSTNSVLS
jgi:predicted nucleotidyltransferase